MPNQKEYVGAWKTSEKFDNLSPEDLEIRTGCAVYLTKSPNRSYIGTTGENSCESTLRGASFATSKVTTEKDKIASRN